MTEAIALDTKPTKSFHVVYLDPQRTHFSRQGDTLSMTLEGDAPQWQQQFPRVILRACFPVSDKSVFLSVRDARDEEQPEIGILEDWTQLSPSDQEAVAAELGLLYFVPRILRIFKIKEELGFLYWTVETDKGHKEFVMRNSVINYAREVGPGHWLLIDVNQARYEIPDINALDRTSRKWLNQFLYL